MSKKSQKKNSRQMEFHLPTSSQVASRANRSASQANKKEQVTTDISGLRCFESSKSLNRGGLLDENVKGILTSKTAWSSRLCALTWKRRIRSQDVQYSSCRRRRPASTRKNLEVANRKESMANSDDIRSIEHRSQEETWNDRTQVMWNETNPGPALGQVKFAPSRIQVDEKIWRTPDAHCDRGPSSEKRENESASTIR